MIAPNSSLNLFLIINSFLTIGLILNQNESSKDSALTQRTAVTSNPFESITWICLSLQIIMLLIKFKTKNF
jgi:hypothetical protein